MNVPSYIDLHKKGDLKKRIHSALNILKSCVLCPRRCRVNRIEAELGVCKTGRWAILSSYGPHFGEESPLVGRHGSGTIFFASCNLLCSFCQNYDISHLRFGDEVNPEELAKVMIRLQKMGCHNINFVTPTHVVPQILEALPIAIEHGLNIPLVYNCGGYEALSTLRLLDGVFDIYMPDFKFWNNEWSEKFCGVTDYCERAQEALMEMHRQVGDLILDERGIARRGLIIRHLVMPLNIAGTAEVARFIATKVSPHSYVNIMAQYRPCGRAVGDPLIGRRITHQEYMDAIEAAKKAGLYRFDKG